MFDSLIQLICQLLSDTGIQRQLVAGFLQRGGLEGWVQVEIANALVSRLPPEVHVEREVSYAALVGGTANLRVDIAILFPQGAPVDRPRLGIELKIESLFQQANLGGSLAQRYLSDVEKVTPYAFSPTTAFVVCGIAITEEANRGMEHATAQLNQSGTLDGHYAARYQLCGRFNDFPITLYWTTFER